MKKQIDIDDTLKKYPSLTELDVHFYGLKSLGIDYENPELGRPKLHILNDSFLFSVVPLLVDPSSPYVLRGKELRFDGEELPFKVKAFKRSNDPYYSYYYFRSKEKWIQTLDSKTSLNLNFNPNCSGCSFCNRIEKSGLENLSAQDGMHLLQKNKIDLTNIDELAIVTGMFKDEKQVISHIKEILTISSQMGFSGRIFYLGSQIKTIEGVRQILESIDSSLFKYAYTLESFTNRNFNHKKQETLGEAIATLQRIKEAGVVNLEYTYMPGIDPLQNFFETTPKIKNIAKPHISIFRPAIEAQRDLLCNDFNETPIDYLCKMRLFLEDLYKYPIYGNNLANLWPFPLSRLHPKFSSQETNNDS